MIAFHFPPMQGSSGLQRTLKFCRNLPSNGWQPTVLSAAARAYPDLSNDLLKEIPLSMRVKRAFALDASKHMAIFGRYPKYLGIPDRWVSWVVGGVLSGISIVRHERPDVIWSTYPIGSAHLIALILHRLYRIPWVVDIRDPMVEKDYPEERLLRRVLTWLESKAMEAASRIVVTTVGAQRWYSERYPNRVNHIAYIPNGFDEADLQNASNRVSGERVTERRDGGTFTLLHSGIVYLTERNPSFLFEAIAGLLRDGRLQPGELLVKFRACRNEGPLRDLLSRFQVEDAVQLLPPISYDQSLREMLLADGLLLLQGTNCNNQVPAKLFEYMGTGKPLLALTDPVGDTAEVVQRSGVDSLAPLDDAIKIECALLRFMEQVRDDSIQRPSLSFARTFSRERQSEQLAGLFDAVHVE